MRERQLAVREGQAINRVRPWSLAATAAIGWAAMTMAVLHVISNHDLLDTVSSYAFTERGGGMLAASMLSMAIGSLAVLGALTAAGLPMSRTPAILFGGWSLGLAAAAVFPADFGQVANPVSGTIHQYACLVAMLSLPGAAFAIADRMRARPELAEARARLLRMCWLTAGLLGVFGLSYVITKLPANPVFDQLSTVLPVGLTQRAVLVMDGVLLVSLVRAARSAGTVRSNEREDAGDVAPATERAGN